MRGDRGAALAGQHQELGSKVRLCGCWESSSRGVLSAVVNSWDKNCSHSEKKAKAMIAAIEKSHKPASTLIGGLV